MTVYLTMLSLLVITKGVGIGIGIGTGGNRLLGTDGRMDCGCSGEGWGLGAVDLACAIDALH